MTEPVIAVGGGALLALLTAALWFGRELLRGRERRYEDEDTEPMEEGTVERKGPRRRHDVIPKERG